MRSFFLQFTQSKFPSYFECAIVSKFTFTFVTNIVTSPFYKVQTFYYIYIKKQTCRCIFIMRLSRFIHIYCIFNMFHNTSCLSTNQGDHFKILLRNKGKKTRIKDTVWFVYSNKYYKLFTELQSLKFKKEQREGKVGFVCLLSIIYAVCFTVEDMQERHNPEEPCIIKMLY